MRWSILLMLLVVLFVGGCGHSTAYSQLEAARPNHHSCFHHGDKPAWSCVRGWYDPDQPDAHRKPSDRKRPPDGYPAPEQDPK